MMTRFFLVALVPVAIAACTTDDSSVTPLAQLSGAQLLFETVHGSPSIEAALGTASTLTLSVPGACPRIGDDVTVDLDGVAMTAKFRGGELDDVAGHICNPISFTLASPEITPTSTLSIRDASTTWTITGDALYADDFTITTPLVAGGVAHVVWQAAQQIDGAYARFTTTGAVGFALATGTNDPGLTVTGNAIDVALPADLTGPGTFTIEASRKASVTRCDGPASCELYVSAGIDAPETIDMP